MNCSTENRRKTYFILDLREMLDEGLYEGDVQLPRVVLADTSDLADRTVLEMIRQKRSVFFLASCLRKVTTEEKASRSR